MILVTVGEDDARQPLLLTFDELEVGKDEVDPRIVRVGKSETEVDHDPLSAATIEIDVHAYLARAAERAKQKFFTRNHWKLVIRTPTSRTTGPTPGSSDLAQ